MPFSLVRSHTGMAKQQATNSSGSIQYSTSNGMPTSSTGTSGKTNEYGIHVLVFHVCNPTRTCTGTPRCTGTSTSTRVTFVTLVSRICHIGGFEQELGRKLVNLSRICNPVWICVPDLSRSQPRPRATSAKCRLGDFASIAHIRGAGGRPVGPSWEGRGLRSGIRTRNCGPQTAALLLS